MGNVRMFNAALVALLSVVLLGCAGSGNTSVGGSAPGTKVLPPIPASRGASDLTETLLNGIEVYLKSAGATEQGTSLSLGSTPGGYEWAMYRFNPGTNAPDSVAVLLSVPLGSGVWIALSDYSAGRWCMHGPYTKGKTLALDDAQCTSPAGDLYVAVLVSGGSTAMVEQLSVRTTRLANVAPTASLTVSPQYCQEGAAVTLDASGSADTDGTVVKYEWDFGGDGSYDSYGSASTAQHAYNNCGLFTIKVRVTDDGGAQDTALASVCVRKLLGSMGWSRDTSLAVVNGFPAVKCYDDIGGLRFVRATDANGVGWDPSVGVDAGVMGMLGTPSSLAVVNGAPAISYYDWVNGDLRYVRAFNAYGKEWDTPLVLDSAGDTGWNSSLAVVDGNPAITYLDYINGDLRYIRATDASGQAWGAPLTIDSAGRTGFNPSLAVVNGNPAISYCDGDNGRLRYIRATDASGETWGTPLSLDGPDTGSSTSLAIVNGNPAISYHDYTNGDLRYIRAADASGTAWGAPLTLDHTGSASYLTSLAVIGSSPAISYGYGDASSLRYIRATDASGAAWGTPLTLDDTDGTGVFSSLAMVNGSAAISYTDNPNGDLWFIRLAP